MRGWRTLVAALSVVLLLATARAEDFRAPDFPNKPIRLIVPFPPGGPNDIIARVIGSACPNSPGNPW
jgi:tripartite-type tricarboxylate transporter receptor subunit TctC